MRKLVLATIAGMLVGAGGAVAVASSGAPIVRASQAASSLRAGTPGHPRGVRLTTTFGWQGNGPADQPMVTRLDLWFPRGSLYNGGMYKSCNLGRLNAFGPTACPRASIVGRGSGTAWADTTVTRPRITVVNGGANAVYFYTVLNNPARVQEAVVGHIARLRGHFAYHLSATIPHNLQIVAGVPIKLTSLSVTAGRGNWIALTGPPAGIKVVTTYNTGASTSYFLWVQNT